MATGTRVENFYAQFGADFKELLAEYKKAERETGRFRASMKRELEDAQGVINRFAAQARSAFLGLAGAFGLGRISQFARETLRWADDMKALADRLGITTESLQELLFAGRELNIESKEMTKGLGDFAVKLAEAASGKGRGVEAFKQMGLSIRDAKGEVKSFDTLLDEFADKLREFDRPSQLALAKTFFGDEGALKFLDLVGKGADHIRKLREEGRATGHVLKNELFDQGEKLNKDVERLEHKIGTDLKQAVLDFAPAWKVALQAVVEVQMAVDKLLSSIRIGGFRVGKEVSPIERRAELERDIAEAERKLAGAEASKPDKFGTATSRGREEAAKLRQDLARMRIELEEVRKQAPLSPAVDKAVVEAQAAARRRAERETPPEEGKRTVDLSGKGAAEADKFARLMIELEANTEKARAALDPYRASIADLDAKLAKMAVTDKQGARAREEFNKAWNALGAKALTEFGAESEHLARIAAAEAAGRRDLVAVLEMEFALRQRFGDKFVKDNQATIEALARQRQQVEDLRQRQADALRELEGLVEGVASSATAEMDAFFNKQKTGWEAFRDFAIRALNDIANKIFQLGAINPILNALFGGNRASLGDIGSLLGLSGSHGAEGVGGVAASAGSSGDFFSSIASFFGFAKGGSFTVGGRGGTDSTPVGFMATPGERVTVETPTQARRGGMGAGTIHLHGGPDSTVRLRRVEAMLQSLGHEVRMIDRSFDDRAVGAVFDAKRGGGTFASAF